MDGRTSGVQSKISCILKTVVRDIPSSKKFGQQYSIEASEELSPELSPLDLHNALPTEKFDGTCCHVRRLHEKVMLWARLDRKPNKSADKRFKLFQKKHREWLLSGQGCEPGFHWKCPEDLKQVPELWIPADGVALDDSSNSPLPDKNGHIPGWVPVDGSNPQYCWHSTVIDYDLGMALTLRPNGGDSEASLEIVPTPLTELEGKTLELIGTNINGNPYNLGDKQHPFHVLVEHGSILVKDLPEVSYESLVEWFKSSKFSKVEGIVWHLKNGKMFKLHRHHLKLPWPIRDEGVPLLSQTSIQFNFKSLPSGEFKPNSMLSIMNALNGKSYEHFSDVFKM